eukprot:Tbor_TRINITY_DN5509_c4_g4::TRINITY_DN5509_c4_g4_i1::g.13319::m.13319
MDDRVYLTTHHIHQVFEQAVKDLILDRPEDSKDVYKCLLDSIARRQSTSKYYILLGANARVQEAIQSRLTDIAVAQGVHVVDVTRVLNDAQSSYILPKDGASCNTPMPSQATDHEMTNCDCGVAYSSPTAISAIIGAPEVTTIFVNVLSIKLAMWIDSVRCSKPARVFLLNDCPVDKDYDSYFLKYVNPLVAYYNTNVMSDDKEDNTLVPIVDITELSNLSTYTII